MLNTFDKFNKIFNKIDISKEVIKTFHVFDESNALFITIDDKVFGFSSNMSPVFGPLRCQLSEPSKPFGLKEICELNDKQILYFFRGDSFALALSSGGKLYSWGYNYRAQLGRPLHTNQLQDYSPKEVKFPKSEAFNPEKQTVITDISCGLSHVLALTLNGTVFGWGSNYDGQVGCGVSTEPLNKVLTPTQIKFKDSNSGDLQLKIKAVYCFGNLSFALTTDGMAYSWGYGSNYRLGYDIPNDSQNCNLFKVLKPKLIDILNVISVCSTLNNTYFLTNEWKIYFCGKYNENTYKKSPEIIKSEIKFSSIDSLPFYYINTSIHSIASIVSEDSVFKIIGNQIIKTDSKTSFDFYGITLSTIHTIKKFEDFFIREEDLPKGGFGIVFKAKNKLNDRMYAIKTIDLEKNNLDKNDVIKETKTLSQCNSDYVVQYCSHWFENKLFYIQLELCSDDLQNIIEQKKILFGREDPNKAMNIKEYFISIELFKELVECVHYLHELKSEKIIHRDLKPSNVLIIENPRNDRFLRLCDFGFAKLGGESIKPHSNGIGTHGYMAPELHSRNYNNKVDIYSLGVIATNLFDTFRSKNAFNGIPTEITNELVTKLGEMTAYIPDGRPKASELLDLFSKWRFSKREIKNLQTEPLVLSNGCGNGSGDSNLQKINFHFFHNFIETKVKCELKLTF